MENLQTRQDRVLSSEYSKRRPLQSRRTLHTPINERRERKTANYLDNLPTTGRQNIARATQQAISLRSTSTLGHVVNGSDQLRCKRAGYL